MAVPEREGVGPSVVHHYHVPLAYLRHAVRRLELIPLEAQRSHHVRNYLPPLPSFPSAFQPLDTHQRFARRAVVGRDAGGEVSRTVAGPHEEVRATLHSHDVLLIIHVFHVLNHSGDPARLGRERAAILGDDAVHLVGLEERGHARAQHRGIFRKRRCHGVVREVHGEPPADVERLDAHLPVLSADVARELVQGAGPLGVLLQRAALRAHVAVERRQPRVRAEGGQQLRAVCGGEGDPELGVRA
mmetsp:Transcript_8893/g.21972  ORF Transcript_8893/g.21972 Transcript_8893/m.21972 type:complete len:244 (+) Transcript_8893:181-912(+)